MLDPLLKALRLVVRCPARAWLMLCMAVWILVLSCLAKIVSLPRALRFISTKSRRTSIDDAHKNEISTAIDVVLGMNFFVFKPNCWKRATILHRFLAQRGLDTTIAFGLRKELNGELKGHAWLEFEGRPILETVPPAYTVTYTFPSTDRFDGELALMATSRTK